MGKKEKVRRMKEAGLHEIKNKYRARAVRKKRRGLVLSAKKKRRALKTCASASAIFLGLLGLFAIGNSFFKPSVFNEVPDDFVTVSYATPTDGSTPDDYEGVEGALKNIGYMNYRFKNQPNWYSETHGTTNTAAGPQSVNTIKQFSDKVLIMVDVARSSIIKAGRQFCYIGNEVMWRNVADGSNYMMDNYEQMLALKWKNELFSHTTIEAFKKKNGLPGTEFTVYVINEETLYYAEPVEVVKSTYAASDWDADYIDGNVYRQTYYLRAGDSERLGAAAHYSNQIVFTGSLQSVSFRQLPSSLIPNEAYAGKDLVGEEKAQGEPLIKVTYTFDSSWQVLHAEIDEAYQAQMGVINTGCTSSFATNFEYGTARTKNPAYEDFFKDHVGEDVEDNLEQPLSSLGLITDAFLSGPVTYELALDINGKKTGGIIALDAAKLGPALSGGGELNAGAIIGGLGIKAQIGDIRLYLEDSTAYLAVGDLKVKLPIEKLLTLIQSDKKEGESDHKPAETLSTETTEGAGTDGEASVFTIKDPVLNDSGTQATVSAVLDLSSLGVELEIPLNFTFNLDENKKASLDICEVSVNYQDVKADITIKDTDKRLPDLGDQEKEAFVDLYDYAKAVYDLVTGKKLNVTLDYADDKMALEGNIGIDFTGELLVAGQLTLSMGEKSKTVGIIVKEGTAYLSLEGIKLSVPIDEAIGLVKGFLTEDGAKESSTEIVEILNKVLSAVFDNDLAALLSISEEGDVLTIGVKGTELLKAFGLDFALGDVNLSVSKSNGSISASAYGANISVAALENGLAVDTAGYIEVLPYVDSILNMVNSGTLTANVAYETKLGDNTLSVSGSIVIALSPLNLSGEITVKYSSLEKTVAIVYDKDGYLYLTLDALKIKASSEDAIALITSLLPTDGDKTEEEESNVYDILDTVLGLDFNELLNLTEITEGENKTLNAVINGNYLLGLFGVDFKLGDITLSVDSTFVKANALGVDVTLLAGGEVTTLSEEAKADYLDCKPLLEKIPDLIPYIERVAELISGKKLEVELHYEDERMSVSGNVGIDFTNGLLVVGTLNVSLGEKTQTLQLAVQDETVYLSLGGIKLYVAVSDISGLIDSLTPDKEAGAEEKDLIAVLEPILSAVLNNDFVSLFTLDEGDDMLTLIGKGTELLKLFGVDFELGEISLTVNKQSGNINVSAYGANVCLKALDEALTFDPTGYTDLLSYAQTVIDMVKGGSLTANVSYETTLDDKALSVSGTLVVELSPLQVSGEITVKYGSLEKTVTLYYGEDGAIYLVIDTLKVKVNSKDAIALIKSIIGTEESDGNKSDGELDLYAVLEKVFALDFDELLDVTENTDDESSVLNVVVHGNYLLGLFGVDFKLGDITLDIDRNGVKVNALGVDLSLVGGGEVTALTEAEKAAYVDLKPVLDALPDLLQYKALFLSGSAVLTAGDTNINLIINEGVLSFADGIGAYLDVSLAMTGLTLNVKVSIDTEGVKLALGVLGVELQFTDFSALGDAVLSLYEEVRKTVNPVSEKELLPQVKAISELFDVLKSLFTTEKGTQTTALDLGDTLSKITIANSKLKNGLLAVSVMGVTLDIVNTPYGFVGLEVAFSNSSLKVEGTINTEVYEGEINEMPEINYLNRTDLEELLDYLVAVVHTLSESEINVKLSGTIGSDDTQTYPDGKYMMEGELRIYSGEDTLIHLDLKNKGLWVNTDAYIYAKVDLNPIVSTDKGIYLELFVLDSDEQGKQDGILDVYLSVSSCLATTARKPLTVYAPANELMPVLSSVLAFLGVDIDILNDYLISPWLSAETVSQMKGLGESLLITIGNILGLDLSEIGSTIGSIGSSNGGTSGALNLNALISAITVGEAEFELELDSETVFGTKGEPLQVKIGKEKGENGSRLTLLSVANIKNTTVKAGITYGKIGEPKPSFQSTSMIRLNGIASLLKALAYSTTTLDTGNDDKVISGQENPSEYVLNRYFYIDGTIMLDLTAAGLINQKVEISVEACSVTIDEDGTVGVNIRFRYSALKVAITVINGDTVVDLTGKDNMVYIKRVQKTDDGGKPLSKDITLYRAMPLSNFGADIVPQMGFLFNLGDRITSLLGNIKMGGDSTEKADEDIGTTVGNILKSISYQQTDAGESWIITINGGFLNASLGDIVVTIGADNEGKIRTLKASAPLSTTGISMVASLDFTFHNPCGVMDQGVWDNSTDVADTLIQAMDYKLSTVNWESTKFIEAELTTIEYLIMGKLITTQDIALATGTTDIKGTVYGTLKYPDLTAYNEKGLVAEWDHIYEHGDPLPDNRQISAHYEAQTYELTFKFRDGSTQSFSYTYGDKSFELPFERVDNLRVAYYVDADGNEYRTAADLMNLDLDGDLTLTAVYERDVYVVTYLIEESRTEEYEYYWGETVALIAVSREGYTFAGWFDGEAIYAAGDTITVYGDVVLVAQWKAVSEEPDSYLITIRSDLPYDGFTGVNGVFVKTYTYNGTPVTLDALNDVDDYWFMGYYTDKNGSGTKLTTVSDLDSDLTLYVYWRSKIVTFTINSDIEFAGSTEDKTNNRYYSRYTLRDKYDLDPYLPKVDGYQTLGLWHQVGDTYERVTDARNLDGEELWVLWIQNIKVTVNNFSESWGTFTIKGHVEGGKVVAGKSDAIFTAIGGNGDDVTGQYSIFSIDGKKSDTLKYNKAISIVGGEFGDERMTSANATGWPAEYGGIKITIKFSYTRPDGTLASISTTDAAYVSKASYTVTYDLKNGTKIPISDIRADYPYDDYDNATYVDELALKNNIFVPEREGHTGYWEHVAVIGNMTVEPIYEAYRYNVRFESDHKIEGEGWEFVDGKYVKELQMKHGSDVTFFNEGEIIASYTVVSDSVFTLPAITDMQKWGSVEITDGYARFVAQRNVDMLIYNSEVPFEYREVEYNSLPVEITEEYTLIAPTAAGHTFLGWFRQVDGGWEKVEKLYPTAGEDKATIVVQALWATDISVEVVSTDKSSSGYVKIMHTAVGRASGGVLKGAFAGEEGVEGTLTLDYYISNSTSYATTSQSKAEFTSYDGTAQSQSFSVSTGLFSGQDYAHIVATVTWTYKGMTFPPIGGAKAHAYQAFKS